MTTTITITTHDEARDAYRSPHLRQSLYTEGEVVMGDVVLNLHGEEHRRRRRLENRLFRREVFLEFQEVWFPPIIQETLKPWEAEGRAELVKLSHQLMMNLAAVTAGVDRPLGTPEETFHLFDYMMKFVEGATIAHYTGDKDERRAEIAEAIERFDEEFLTPSIRRRETLLAQVAAGEAEPGDVPRDVLSVLVDNADDLHLPHEVLRREIAFFLLAGAHTSATAFTRTLHHVFEWRDAHAEDAARLRSDRLFLQRCVHETIRLWPSSPIARRVALEGFTLKSSGREVPEGATVVVDLMAVNRDPELFGEDGAEFNPRRELPPGMAPWGLSFGGGMHVCIGQDLAAGVLPNRDSEEHLFGLVPVAVQALLDRGVRPDPDDPPAMDTTTARPYWGHYPVRFDA